MKPSEIPEDAEEFKLATNGQFGMVNLCWPLDDSTKAEIEAIDGSGSSFIVGSKVKIYFPSFEYFYMKTYRNKDGFTLGEVVEKIAKTGHNALKNRYKGNEIYVSFLNINLLSIYQMSAADVERWQLLRSDGLKFTLKRSIEAIPKWQIVKHDGLKITLKRSTEALEKDNKSDTQGVESPTKKTVIDKNN